MMGISTPIKQFYASNYRLLSPNSELFTLGFEVFRKSKNDRKFPNISEISSSKIRYGTILKKKN